MGWYRRIRRALELLTAVERLQDKLRGEGTPYEAAVGFDYDRLMFYVQWGGRRVEGWPLCELFKRL